MAAPTKRVLCLRPLLFLANKISINSFKSLSFSRRQKNKDDRKTFNSFSDDQTHFGYETISVSEKEQRVHQVFTSVAEKYDLMNDVMSAGIHRCWKNHFVDKLGPTPGIRLLDMAGGTGDIAFRFLQYLENVSGPSSLNLHSVQNSSDCSSDQSHVTVCDINEAMLDIGKKRAQNLRYCTDSNISWLCANAENLPLPDNSYDAYTIVFGIRNCTHIDKVLCEAHRVLRRGGRFLCLEFSSVRNPILRKLYDEYSFQLIPVMGQIIAADWHSYQYLVESIRKFPTQEHFSDLIRVAGLNCVTHENLLGGVAAIHSAFKL